MKKIAVLLFAQYRLKVVPSRIPIGGDDLRALWQSHEEFADVPIQETRCLNPQTERGVGFWQILGRQRQEADKAIRKAHPDFILTTGGDCGASYSSIAYLNEKYNGKVGVIWVDAHADVHLPSVSIRQLSRHGFAKSFGESEFDVMPPKPLCPNQIAFWDCGIRKRRRMSISPATKIHVFRPVR